MNQKEEIMTIKGRNISLNLSDADCQRLAEKAVLGGITPSELLEGFIGDLVDGTYSHGSDERMYAQQWYDRCGFTYEAPKDFLHYLLVTQGADAIKDVLADWDDMCEMKEDLADAKTNSQEYTPADVAAIEEALQYSKVGINDMFIDYLKWANTASIDQEKEIHRLRAWQDEVKQFVSPEIPVQRMSDRFAQAQLTAAQRNNSHEASMPNIEKKDQELR